MLEKKKILFVITKGNFGGAQRYVFDLATNLPKDQFETIVACGTKEGTSLIEKLEEEKIKTIKLENSEREINLKNDFKTIKELIQIIKKERPNVVHLNSSKIGVLGSLAILYLKFLNSFSFVFRNSYFVSRCIFTAHGWAFNEPGRSVFSKIVFYLGHYLTILICDQTVAVSEKAKRDMDFLPFTDDKMKVVYNGVSAFEPEPREEARKFLSGPNPSTSSEQAIIYSISELNLNKGVDVALRGLSLLPQEVREKIIYCVAGGGEEKATLKKLAQELGVDHMVKFLGFVPDAKKYISGCDFFLLPSRTEAFPYVILEAGLAGAPIIATGVGGIPEVVRDMQNGILIHSQNPKEIAEAVLYYLDHPQKQKEFGEEIKKTVTNFFGLEKMLKETAILYC